MVNIKMLVGVIVISLIGLSGCAPTPIYQHEPFEAEKIDRITVMPFLDNRKNPDPDLHFEKIANFARSYMIRSMLYSKKYRTVLSGDIGNVSSYSIQDLPARDQNAEDPFAVDPESVDSGWIRQLGPPNEKWVLVPVLEDVNTTNILIQVHGTATITAYLFNKDAGELWWQCKGSGEIVIGIITYGIMKASTSQDNLLEALVLSQAGYQCAAELPERPEPYLLSGI